ncbi:hypothetical protein [Lentibacillus sp. Marseille-P4043]|uniref:hypothetical protein n=1 Tax=Lentibacillus sp. Marseille-P4043 TaxID=2040293 RepID=UPI000D0BBB2F|nr:hypothetical protein [Lentibacillus sp. Marseille-P4043]
MEKYITYVELFSRLYKEGKIDIKWLKNSSSFRVSKETEKEIEHIGVSREDFIKTAFEIVRVCQMLASGNIPKSIEQEKIRIITENFLTQEILEFINVHSHSKNDVIEGFDYDILTKRSEKDLSNVIAYTGVLNFIVSDVYGETEESNQKKVTIELSKMEINKLIDKLKDIYDMIESLEVSEGEKNDN